MLQLRPAGHDVDAHDGPCTLHLRIRQRHATEQVRDEELDLLL